MTRPHHDIYIGAIRLNYRLGTNNRTRPPDATASIDANKTRHPKPTPPVHQLNMNLETMLTATPMPIAVTAASGASLSRFKRTIENVMASTSAIPARAAKL